MSDQLSDKTRKLFLAFKKAIEGEQTNQSAYKEAISICEDEECRKVLERFLEETIHHEKELMNEFKEPC